MSIAPEDLPQTPGQNASLSEGQATQFAQERKDVESAGSPQPQQGPPGAAPQGPPPQQPPQPVQAPPPRVPLNANDMRPGGPVFMQPQTSPAAPWRQELRTWAQHPDARILRQLSQRADAGLQTKPPQPGQQ